MRLSVIRIAPGMVTGLILAVSLSTAAPAQLSDQQPRPGSRIPEKIPTTEVGPDQTRILQARFADCVVKKHPEKARTFVLRFRYRGDKEPGGGKVLRSLGDGACLIGAAGDDYSAAMMKFPADTFGYVLAEALFRVELASRPAISNLGRVAPLEHPTLHEEDFAPARSRARSSELDKAAEQRALDVGRIYLSKFGECIVRGNPVGAYDLLTSGLATAQEDAAFKKLAGTFQSCRLDEHTVAFSKTLVRGAIAYNYYRLANAPLRAPTAPINQ